MKCFAIVLFIFLYFIADIFTANYIHSVDEEEYKILKDLTWGTFTKSKKECTRKEKSAVIRFWRAKGKFKVVQGKLYYDGKDVSEWLC